jgi:hypothetical protein
VPNEDGCWRIRMIYEMDELIENTDIVRYIKKEKKSLVRSRDADG